MRQRDRRSPLAHCAGSLTIAKSVLSQFTRFLGVPFSDTNSCDFLFMIMILKLSLPIGKYGAPHQFVNYNNNLLAQNARQDFQR